MKHVAIDPSKIRPLPKPMWNSICSDCSKPIARWEQVEGLKSAIMEPKFVCALCYFYKSAWGVERKEDIDNFVAELKKTTSRVIELDSSGRILKIGDADDLLGTFALTSLAFQLSGVARKQRELS